MPMKRIATLFCAIVLALAFVGCEEKIDLDLDDLPPAIVITGRITSGGYGNYVRVSKSAPYLSDAESYELAVNNAVVILTEDGMVSDTLERSVSNPPGTPPTISSGYYTGPLLQSGKVGSVYTLTVIYDGKTYTAVDTIRPITPIDSLTYKYESQTANRDEGYYVSLHTQEPIGIGNHYQWMYRWSNAWGGISRMEELDQIANDEWVDGNYISIQLDGPQQVGDTVIVEMLSISKQYYTFVSQLLNQESFGDLFDTPPANVKGNISNGAYGYWHAAGVAGDTIVIQ